MVAPQITFRITDLTLYAPRTSNAVTGCVGPATKGPINRLNDFTDEGNFFAFHGEPQDRMHSQRAFGRYLQRGDQGKYVRVAGPNLATATLTLYAADGITPILNVVASSPGSHANDGGLAVAVTHNGTQSYNLRVYENGQPTPEQFIGVNNGNVETRVNNNSTRIQVTLALGAGTTFPAATINPVTGAVDPRNFAGGNDGAFAQTESQSSSTSGVAGRRFFGKLDSVAGSRVFLDILTIDAALAGLTIARGTLPAPAVPGTVTIRAQTGAATFVELSDDGDLSYAPGAAGLGILEGAGGVLGSIDYRTGAFVIDITASAATFFATGTISAIFVRGVSESVGATVRGQSEYAGNLSTFKLAPGFYNANKAVLTVPVDEISGTVGLGATAAASSDATLKTLQGWLVPGSIHLAIEHPTDAVPPDIYDDGLGGWRTQPNGGGTAVPGTINYRTGAYTVTTWDPVGGVAFPGVTVANLRARYDFHLFNMGGGAVPGEADAAEAQVLQTSDDGVDATAADTDTGAQRMALPISPGNIRLTISDVSGSPFVVYDDGVGGWLDRPRGDPRAVAVTGSVDYTAGAWTVTAGASITLGAQVSVVYTSTPFDQARRALRASSTQLIADTTPNDAGQNITTDPAAANNYNGLNYLDHTTGEFNFCLDLITTGAQTFDLLDNGTLTAVYLPVAEILGFGDGSETIFTGLLQPAPFRRQDDRLVAFQAAQASSAGAGDPQVALATLGVDPSADYWSQNVAVSTDPDNFLDFRDGSTSIQWTGAPTLDEAVFVAAEEVVLHFVARYAGDIGNERDVLSDGFYGEVRQDPTVAGTLQLRLFFGTEELEAFGQAPTLDDLVNLINSETNGSDFVRAVPTADAGSLDPDVTAAQTFGLAGAFTVADIVGTKVGSTTTGLQMFRNSEVVPLDWVMLPGAWHAGAIAGLDTLTSRPGRRAIGIIPTPDTEDIFEVADFVNGEWNATAPGAPARPTAVVPFPPTVAIDSSQLAVFAPWVNYLDQFTNDTVLEPPDGEIAALVANTDAVAQPWFPIAGGRRGRILATGLKYSAELEDRNLVYGLVGQRTEIVNALVAFTGRGIELAGQRTAQRSATALDRINVRWTLNVIINKLDAGVRDFNFELNDTILWRELKAFVDSILEPIKERRGLQDFFVLIDQTTTTAIDIDNLTVNAKVFIKPPRAVEFIDFDIVLTPTGADFADVAAA